MTVTLFAVMLVLTLRGLGNAARILVPRVTYQQDAKRKVDAMAQWDGPEWAGFRFVEAIHAAAIFYALYLIWPR